MKSFDSTYEALERKKIRKEARRNNLLVIDITNAVKSIRYQRLRNHQEANIYKDLVVRDSNHLWDVAEYIVKFMNDFRSYEENA